jgi:hypothetical protein
MSGEKYPSGLNFSTVQTPPSGAVRSQKNHLHEKHIHDRKIALQLPCHSSATGHKTLFRHVISYARRFLCVNSRELPQNEYGMTQPLHHAERSAAHASANYRFLTPPFFAARGKNRLPGFDASDFSVFRPDFAKNLTPRRRRQKPVVRFVSRTAKIKASESGSWLRYDFCANAARFLQPPPAFPGSTALRRRQPHRTSSVRGTITRLVLDQRRSGSTSYKEMRSPNSDLTLAHYADEGGGNPISLTREYPHR